MNALLIAIVLLGFMMFADRSAEATSHCGGLNETPCKLWERIPSCDAGLVENFAQGKCVRGAKAAKPVAKPAPIPVGCGMAGGAPCKVWERIPSCNSGLIEDFKKGKCVQPATPIVCGKAAQRPCKVWERVPSCDRSLAEDFSRNRCARPQDIARNLQVAACQAIVGAIRTGKDVVKLTETLPLARQRQSDMQNRLTKDAAFKTTFMNRATAGIQANQHAVPELKRIAAWLNDPKNRAALDSIFSAEDFCQDSVADTDAKLRRLGLVPNFAAAPAASGQIVASAAPPAHFFMGYQATFAGGAGVGVQAGLMGVTDFQGAGARHFFIGGQLVTNVMGGVTVEVMFFPQVTLESFDDWGWGAAISAGPPTRAVSGAVNVVFDESFSQFQGFGFGPGVGLGASPVDIGVSYTYASKY